MESLSYKLRNISEIFAALKFYSSENLEIVLKMLNISIYSYHNKNYLFGKKSFCNL